VPQTGVVVIGGDPPHPGVLAHLPEPRYVVAADSGLDHAIGLGLTVHHVVGDLDSVSTAALASVEGAGVPVERHPPEKDATDAELALDLVLAAGCTRVVVVSGGGDRLDHVLGALALLGRPVPPGVRVEAWWGRAHVTVLHGPDGAPVGGAKGTIVSLLPLHGPASGVTTAGLRYPLDGETLEPTSSRGISNELTDDPAAVHLAHGTLAVIVPHAIGEPR
jgi:thiamine pyrophosphokinase